MSHSTLGVDISKAHSDVYLAPEDKQAQFPNEPGGFKALVGWLGKTTLRCIVYEPTGPWHRAFERALLAKGLPLARVNAYQARRFAQAIGQQAKTNPLDAQMLARMGAALDLLLAQTEPPGTLRPAGVADHKRRAHQRPYCRSQSQQTPPAAFTQVPEHHPPASTREGPVCHRRTLDGTAQSRQNPGPRSRNPHLDPRRLPGHRRRHPLAIARVGYAGSKDAHKPGRVGSRDPSFRDMARAQLDPGWTSTATPLALYARHRHPPAPLGCQGVGLFS